jgi:hypothetical protein
VTDEDLAMLRLQAAAGDQDAVAQLVELAGERGDLDELRRLAAGGNTDAADILVELAGERGDLDELRRLVASGHTDAADVLRSSRTTRTTRAMRNKGPRRRKPTDHAGLTWLWAQA